MSDKTNLIGPGTKNVTFNVPDSLFKQINLRAAKSGMTRSSYLRLLLEEDTIFETVRVVRKKKE